MEYDEEIEELGKNLTQLQRSFVINLVSAKMTMREAYYAAGGRAKTDRTADASACQLLTNINVIKYKDAMQRMAVTSSIMSREEAMARLSVFARANIKDFVTFGSHEVGIDGDGNPVYQSAWSFKGDGDISDDHAACITELAVGREGIKFKIQSQAQAIKQLADMAGWNIKQADDSAADAIAKALAAIAGRLPD